MLRSACVAVLLAALTACSPSVAGGLDGPDGAPRVGVCRVLVPGDLAQPSNDSEPVDCAREHTAQTFAAGTFPASLARHGRDSARLGAYVHDRCRPAFARFLSGDDSLLLRSTLTWAWFRAPDDAWDDGARTWRCDVVGGGEQSKTFVGLPRTARGLLRGRPDDRWLVCVDGPTVTGSVKIPCSEPHTWRAVTTIVLGRPADPYPGDRVSETRTRDFCSDSVGAWLGYPVDYDFGYTWFHAAEWEAGNRRAICWAKTPR